MRTTLRLLASAGVLFTALVGASLVQAAQTINTSSTTSCVAQGGTISGANLLTDFDNGTFGTGSGAPNQSPNTDPYPSTVTGGDFTNFYDLSLIHISEPTRPY